jgi:hypothetical protein
MKTVTLEYFKEPVFHKNVKEIIFRGEMDTSSFDIGFVPEMPQFMYHFDISPDVYFNRLPISQVYYEPYRTFLRLRRSIDLMIHWKGFSDKLYIERSKK